MHASNHAALSGHIRPVDHLLCIVEVQCYCIIKTLRGGKGRSNIKNEKHRRKTLNVSLNCHLCVLPAL